MSDRQKQPMPEDLVNSLMALVRGQFCGDLASNEWAKHSHFVRRNVIMWPAHFICNVKGFTLPAKRYEQIMRSIFIGIKQHGQTGAIRYWPGYLMKCVQDHWKIHWEEYYAEAKSVQNIADNALVTLGRVLPTTDKTVESIALAHKVLTSSVKKKRRPAPALEQSLPGL